MTVIDGKEVVLAHYCRDHGWSTNRVRNALRAGCTTTDEIRDKLRRDYEKPAPRVRRRDDQNHQMFFRQRRNK